MPTTDALDRITEAWGRQQPGLDTSAMALFGRIHLISRMAGDRMERLYARFSVSRADFDLLAALRRDGEPFRLSPRQLSVAMMITTGGTTGRLDRLERAGLVRRLPDGRDRRCLQVELTAEGLRMVDQAMLSGLADQQSLLAGFAAEDLQQLTEALRAVLRAIGEAAAGAQETMAGHPPAMSALTKEQ